MRVVLEEIRYGSLNRQCNFMKMTRLMKPVSDMIQKVTERLNESQCWRTVNINSASWVWPFACSEASVTLLCDSWTLKIHMKSIRTISCFIAAHGADVEWFSVGPWQH